MTSARLQYRHSNFSNSPPNELYLHRPHYNSDIALQISEDNFFLHQSPTHASSCCIVVVYACNTCNIDFFVVVSFGLPGGGCVSKDFETYVSQVHVKDGNILRSSSHMNIRTVQVRLAACSVYIEYTYYLTVQEKTFGEFETCGTTVFVDVLDFLVMEHDHEPRQFSRNVTSTATCALYFWLVWYCTVVIDDVTKEKEPFRTQTKVCTPPLVRWDCDVWDVVRCSDGQAFDRMSNPAAIYPLVKIKSPFNPLIPPFSLSIASVGWIYKSYTKTLEP